MGRRGERGGVWGETGWRRMRRKGRAEVLLLYSLSLPFSSPRFPSLPFTSWKFYPRTRGNFFSLSPLLPPSHPSLRFFPLCQSFPVTLAFLSVPSLRLPLAFCAVYLFEHEAAGCRETQKQHTVLVLRLSAEAKVHCSTAV